MEEIYKKIGGNDMAVIDSEMCVLDEKTKLGQYWRYQF